MAVLSLSRKTSSRSTSGVLLSRYSSAELVHTTARERLQRNSQYLRALCSMLVAFVLMAMVLLMWEEHKALFFSIWVGYIVALMALVMDMKPPRRVLIKGPNWEWYQVSSRGDVKRAANGVMLWAVLFCTAPTITLWSTADWPFALLLVIQGFIVGFAERHRLLQLNS